MKGIEYSKLRSGWFRVIAKTWLDDFASKWGLTIYSSTMDDGKTNKMIDVFMFEKDGLPMFPIGDGADLESDFFKELSRLLPDQWSCIFSEVVVTEEKRIPICRQWAVTFEGRVIYQQLDTYQEAKKHANRTVFE